MLGAKSSRIGASDTARVVFRVAREAKGDFTLKTIKGSNPLSSAAKRCFSLGISHFLRVPRDFCSLHATRCVSPAALHFASRCQNRVVFRVALWRQNIGLLHTSRVARESPVAEGVVFELFVGFLETRGW